MRACRSIWTPITSKVAQRLARICNAPPPRTSAITSPSRLSGARRCAMPVSVWRCATRWSVHWRAGRSNQSRWTSRLRHRIVWDAQPAQRPGLLTDLGLGPIDLLLVPLERQVAEKLHALTRTYSGGETTRVRDLVDLLLVRQHEHVDAAKLRERHSAGLQSPGDAPRAGPPSASSSGSGRGVSQGGGARWCRHHTGRGPPAVGGLAGPCVGRDSRDWRRRQHAWTAKLTADPTRPRTNVRPADEVASHRFCRLPGAGSRPFDDVLRSSNVGAAGDNW